MWSILFSYSAVKQSFGPYRQVPGGLIHVTASTNYLWGVNRHHQIYRCSRPCNGEWAEIGGALKQVDASDDEVWGVNSGDAIYKRPVDGSGSWIRIPGGLKHVSASGNGYIWGVNRNDEIFKCKKPCNGQWQLVGGRLKQIDGGESYVYGVNSANDVFFRPIDGTGEWRHIPGRKLKHVTASGDTRIYGVDTEDNIYTCQKPCYEGYYYPLDGKLAQLDGAFNTYAGVNSAENIFVRPIGVY